MLYLLKSGNTKSTCRVGKMLQIIFTFKPFFCSYSLQDEVRLRADSIDSVRGTPSSLSADEQDLSPLDQLPR